MAQVYLSGTNGFVPSATGQAIAFARDPAKYKVNAYTQNIRTPKVIGLYAILDRDQPVRVVTDQEFAWEDGDPRPSGNNNMGGFQWKEFKVERRDYPYTVGEQAIEQAEGWNPRAFFNASIISQAMVNRTKRVIGLLEDTTKWPAASTATATALNGGKGTWATASNDPSSGNFLAIKRSIMEVERRIALATNSVVQPQDLVVVMSPGAAIAVADTSEYHTYIEKSPFALAQLQGDVANQNQQWGIGTRLYGVEVVIEDAVWVSTRPSATTNATDTTGDGGTRAFIKSDTSAVVLSRKGGINGLYGSASYSTLQCYFYKYELSIEGFDDTKNKRVEAHCVEQYKEVLAAPAAGFLITSIT